MPDGFRVRELTEKPIATTFWTRLGLCLGTPALLWLAFPPADLGLLAWVALVPFLVYVAIEERRGRLYRWSYVSGFFYYLVACNWIRHVGWYLVLLIALYLAAYPLFFAWLTRLLIPRVGFRFYLGVPIVYAACERLREWIITGFPWFELGHTQHARLWLIQVCDLTGVAGLNLLVAAVNAAVAGLVLRCLERGRAGLADKGVWGAIAGLSILLGGVLAYGHWRLEHARRIEGPEIGLVQGNIPQDVKELEEEISAEDWDRLAEGWWRTQAALTDQMLAGRGKPPDMVVWAETMFPWPFYTIRGKGPWPPLSLRGNRHLDRLYRKVETEWRTRFLLGAQTDEYDPAKKAYRDYNSTYLLSPEAAWEGRYDKIRLVIFGEYVPMQDDWPWVESLVKWASKITSVSSCRRGTQVTVYRLGAARFGTPICFEIMFADACREMVTNGANFLVTVSNDGWFRDSEELDQILIVTKFRAVENRVGIVRATNTGVSAFVTPWGEEEKTLAVDGRRKEVAGWLVHRVLLRDEETFYTRHGDLLGVGCQTAALFLAVVVLGARLRRRLISRRARVG